MVTTIYLDDNKSSIFYVIMFKDTISPKKNGTMIFIIVKWNIVFVLK